MTLKSKMMRTIRLNDLNSHLNFYKKYLDLSINESSILIQSTFFVLSTLTRQFCSYNQFTRFFFVSFYKILYQVFFEHDEKTNNPWKGLIKSLLILLSTLITCKHYFSRFHLILSLSRETERKRKKIVNLSPFQSSFEAVSPTSFEKKTNSGGGGGKKKKAKQENTYSSFNISYRRAQSCKCNRRQ